MTKGTREAVGLVVGGIVLGWVIALGVVPMRHWVSIYFSQWMAEYTADFFSTLLTVSTGLSLFLIPVIIPTLSNDR